MLNAEWIDSHSGQKKPRIFRQLDVLNLHRIGVRACAAKSQFERVCDGFLRCIAYAASQRSAGNLDEVPSAVQKFLLDAAGID